MNKDGRQLRPGEAVEVRSAAEILATLDEDGALDGMPFMPEMLRFAGQRFEVSHRVEKICDTATRTYRSRRMHSTVLLDDLRCDGSAHGGCQAGCRLYWKEAWLKRPDDTVSSTGSEAEDAKELEPLLHRATLVRSNDGEIKYRCQATQAPAASEEIGRLDPRQYIREVSAGNFRGTRVVWILIRAIGLKIGQVVRRGADRTRLPTDAERRDLPPGSFEPGALVQVRSWEEIAATLDEHGKNRGLWFDDLDMTRYCGGTYRVRDRVRHIIDEGTGKMINIESDCLILENVCCSGERSPWRWCCPRGIYSFWREDWLRPVSPATVEPGHAGRLAEDVGRPPAQTAAV